MLCALCALLLSGQGDTAGLPFFCPPFFCRTCPGSRSLSNEGRGVETVDNPRRIVNHDLHEGCPAFSHGSPSTLRFIDK